MADETKTAKKNEDFLYIVRIGSKDLNGERNVRQALADLKGIGDRLAGMIITKLNLDQDKKIGELKEDQPLLNLILMLNAPTRLLSCLKHLARKAHRYFM